MWVKLSCLGWQAIFWLLTAPCPIHQCSLIKIMNTAASTREVRLLITALCVDITQLKKWAEATFIEYSEDQLAWGLSDMQAYPLASYNWNTNCTVRPQFGILKLFNQSITLLSVRLLGGQNVATWSSKYSGIIFQ